MTDKLTTTEGVATLRATITSALTTYEASLRDPAPPPNQGPTVTIAGPATATVGDTVAYTATATDPDGTIATYEWAVGGLPVPGSTPSIMFTAAVTTTVTCRVTDNAGAPSSATLAVTVTAPVPPVSGAGCRVDLSTAGQLATYTRPPGALDLLPTDNLQAKIDAAPAGAIFWFTAGTFLLPGVGNDYGLRPKQGQQFHGHPQSVITRNGARGKAFIANAGMGNVLLSNLRIQDMVQGSTAETAAVTSLDAPGPYNAQPGGPNRLPGKGWTIRHCTITRCSAGIHAGTGTVVEDCNVSGCYGVGCKTWGEDVIVRRTIANACNMVQEPGKTKLMAWGGSYDSGYESGGVKMWKGAGCVAEDIVADGNGGAGVWSDYGNAERFAPAGEPVTYAPRVLRYITARNNLSSGVAGEMSDRIEIAYCLVTGNQDWNLSDGRKAANSDWINGGIGIYDCPGAWIHHNVVTDNDGATVLQFRPRGPIGWTATPEVASSGGVLGSIAGCRVEDNVFAWTRGKMGIRQIPDDDFPTAGVWIHHDKAFLAPYWAGILWRRNTLTCTDGSSTSNSDKTNPFMVPAAAKTEWDFDYLTKAGWTVSGRS